MASTGLAMAVGLLIPAGAAQAGTPASAAPSYLCDDNGVGSCLAGAGSGHPISSGNFATVVYPPIESVVADPENLPKVNENNCTPFSSCGCDQHYNGKTVEYLNWQGTSLFLRDSRSLGDQVVISGTEDLGSEWVQNGGWFVNVAATNASGANCSPSQPAWVLTWRPNTGVVWTASGGSYDATKQNWEFLFQ
ncbi:MAG TPA: hypothetical protein VF070_14680 [Streptosporangiaceae bacterium]